MMPGLPPSPSPPIAMRRDSLPRTSGNNANGERTTLGVRGGIALPHAGLPRSDRRANRTATAGIEIRRHSIRYARGGSRPEETHSENGRTHGAPERILMQIFNGSTPRFPI